MDRSVSLEQDSLTDEEIINQVLDGHIDRFEVIVRRYNQHLFRIIRSYLTDEDDARDVLQTTYLKAFEHLSQFRAEARFSTWLIRIAINEALKLINQKKRTSSLIDVTQPSDRNQIDITKATTPESMTIQNDMITFLEQAVDRLPQKYRNVFMMREVEQMSVKETAGYLNISRVNVKVRLHRARKLLYEELKKVADYKNLFSFEGARCDSLTEQVMKKITSK